MCWHIDNQKVIQLSTAKQVIVVQPGCDHVQLDFPAGGTHWMAYCLISIGGVF